MKGEGGKKTSTQIAHNKYRLRDEPGLGEKSYSKERQHAQLKPGGGGITNHQRSIPSHVQSNPGPFQVGHPCAKTGAGQSSLSTSGVSVGETQQEMHPITSQSATILKIEVLILFHLGID